MSSEDLEHIDIDVLPAAERDRTITCKGELIRIYKDTKVLWTYKNEEEIDSHLVPAGYEIEVVNASVGLTDVTDVTDGSNAG